MKILVYNNDGTAFKQLLENNGVKLGYTKLRYSTSLQGLGSCSFSFPKSDPQGYIDKYVGVNFFDLIKEDFIGLERIYIEDNEGNIAWGGINSDLDSDTETSSIKCLELKSYFKTLKSPLTIATGNGLTAIEDILFLSQSTITLHPDSEMVDDVDVKIPNNANVYDAIKLIIENTYSRWILVHEKVGALIETKLLCRSILGVSPQGVGLDRSRDSLEVENDEKRFYVYDEIDTTRSNIISYKATQKHKSVVSNCIVQFKDGGGIEQTVESQEPQFGDTHFSPSQIQDLWGKNEKVITSLELSGVAQAQALANREVQIPDNMVTLNLPPSDKDDVFVGDRVDFQILSGAYLTLVFDENANAQIGSARWRIEEKTVIENDGYLSISLKLSARNTVPYEFTIFENIAKNGKETNNLNSNVISG